jgi:NADP-dependent 3-hydroxy acid dehydrogenase YdfG
MAEDLHGKVVVITGASSGVGRACARAFGERGASVALLARNEEALRAAAEEITAAGGQAETYPVDVSDADAVERAAAAVVQRWGRIDTWVNDAMVTLFAPVMEITPAEFKRVTEVTYLGYVYGTQAALRRMVPRDEGTIVQIGSALAYRSIPLQSAYCAAKAAIRGFTDSLRSELIHDGSHVRLTMVQLPAVNTPQFVVQRNKLDQKAQPVPPIYTPELIAEAVVWAAEHAPREMLVAGSAVKAVWGQKFIPGWLDRYLASHAYKAQQTSEPNDPSRPDNLFDPVPGDHGARGPFTGRSRGSSTQLWLRMHSPSLGVVAAAVVSILGLVAGRRVLNSHEEERSESRPTDRVLVGARR